jgi:monoamine oxidase
MHDARIAIVGGGVSGLYAAWLLARQGLKDWVLIEAREALGLERFEQHESGDMVVERSPAEAPLRVRGRASAPSSMRLVGGMGSLIEALRQRPDATRIVTGQAVRRLRHLVTHVELEGENTAGSSTTWRAEHVRAPGDSPAPLHAGREVLEAREVVDGIVVDSAVQHPQAAEDRQPRTEVADEPQ